MSRDDDEDDELEQLGPGAFSPSSWHGQTMAQMLSQPRGKPVPDSDELQRILNLPIREPVTEGSATAEAMVAMGMAKYARQLPPGNCPCGCGFACNCAAIDKRVATIDERTGKSRRRCLTKLKWQQAWALYEMSVVGGLGAAAPVGLGKTLLDILASLAVRDTKLALLVVPANLRHQIITDYQLVSSHFYTPNFVVHLPGKKTWRGGVQYRPDGSLAPTTHVVPYSFISDEHNSQWIERLQPDLLIWDEFDSLSAIDSSRTIRFLRYIEEHQHTTRCVGWTGSPMDSSISEMAHILMMCLRARSPMPTNIKVIDQFGRHLDAVKNPCPAGALKQFLAPGEDASMVRQAYGRRLASTAGMIVLGGRQIVRTDAGEIVENDIREAVAPPIPEKVLEALRRARDNFRPDSLVGDMPAELDDIMNDELEQARVVRQIAMGVYLRWNWNGVPRPLALEWLAKRRAYNSELRDKMLRGDVLLDSPKLCEDAAKRAWGDLPPDPNLPSWRAENWPAWRDIRDKCAPTTEPMWLSKYLVEDAANWAASNRGILWYGMREFAAELGKLTGLRVYGEGSGRDVEKITGEETAILSIQSLGRGTNGLQFIYDTQRILTPFASSRRGQQVLGRLARDGQQSTIVSTDIYLHTRELRKTFDEALNRCDVVQDIMSEEQMLLRGWRGYATDVCDS